MSRSTENKRPRQTPAEGSKPRKVSAATRKGAGPRRAKAASRQPRRSSGADLLALGVVAGLSMLAACNVNSSHDSGAGAPDSALPGEVTVHFLDVGQGDAILVRSPEGKTLLIDGGRSASRMAAHLDRYHVDKIDLMVASHADADHIAGLIEAAKTRPTRFLNNGLAATTQTWNDLVGALQAAGTIFEKANAQVYNVGSVKVRVLEPPADMGDDQNNNSVGIRLDFGQFHALFTGDSEKEETSAWLAQNRAEILGPVQLYKSIHHGANNGDHQVWLSRVRPQNVVISVGANSYGHPTPEILALYRQNGIKVFRTDQQGTVTFRAKADGTYAVQTER